MAAPVPIAYSDPLLVESWELESYDSAIRDLWFHFGSWEAMAKAVEPCLPEMPPPKQHAVHLKRLCLDRRLPLHYACALVRASGGKVSLFDIYPYLPAYLDLDKENP